jgi:hypothetical protein
VTSQQLRIHADGSTYLVALIQEELGQVGTILSGDSCNQRNLLFRSVCLRHLGLLLTVSPWQVR